MKWLDRHTVFTPHLILCGSEKEYFKVMKHLNITYPAPWIASDGLARCHTFTLEDKITCVVCLDVPKAHIEKDQICVIGTLIHEATHVWQELCLSIGEDKPSAEFEAYSIQRISQQLLWSYKKQREAL